MKHSELWKRADGSFILGGYTEVYEPDEDFVNISKEGHNMFFVKLKANGEKVWERSLGGKGNQKSFDLIATKDGGFLSVGTTDSNPQNGIDAFIVTLSSEGSIDKDKIHGSIVNFDKVLYYSNKPSVVCFAS